MTRASALFPIALVFLCACASPGGPEGRNGMRPGGPGGEDGFTMAVRLVDQGEYEQALPILRCVAGQGSGFEIAQYLAGYSAMQMSVAPATPGILRDELRIEGFDRLILAANAGWPTAQAELATRYAATTSEEAPVQAAYWAAVYRRNARDRTYGLDRLDNGVEARIAARIDPELAAEIEQRAAELTIQPLAAIAVTPACAPFLGSARSSAGGRQGGRPSRGGRGGGRPGGGDGPRS